MTPHDLTDIPEPRHAPFEAKPRRRRRTWPIFVAIVSAVLLMMAVVGWLVGAARGS